MNVPVRRRGAIPFGLFAMLALSACVEFGIARRELDWMTADDWDWRATKRAADSATSTPEILVFGDSQIKLGVLPDLVEQTSGRKTLGLAVVGGHVAGSYYLARRAFDAGAKPKAIVIDFLPHFLEASPFEFVRPWEELLGPADGLDMAIRYRDAEFAARTFTRRLLPSIRYRTVLRAGFLAALDGKFTPKSWETAPIWRNLRVNRGGMVVPVVPAYKGQFDPKNPVLFPERWQGDAVNVDYARRLLSLAKAKGARVYWLFPPIVPEAQRQRDRLAIEARWDRFVKRFLDEFDNLVVLDARRSGYGDSAFWDPIHLTRSGSATLSIDAAQAIDRVERGMKPAEGRRISLPRYRPVGKERSLEDIEQSRMAIQKREEGRRR